MISVMLVCSAGMSTSLLVEKVKTAAKEKDVELNITALSETEAKNDYSRADILLLGPQVRYLESVFRRVLNGSGTKLAVVDMLAYGRMDGEKVLSQILSLAEC